MGIPIQKILTISARDYCDMYSRDIRSYEAVGLHIEGLAEDLAEIAPEGTEVVVGYRFSISTAGYVTAPVSEYVGEMVETDEWSEYKASGTALIPKDRTIKNTN